MLYARHNLTLNVGISLTALHLTAVVLVLITSNMFLLTELLDGSSSPDCGLEQISQVTLKIIETRQVLILFSLMKGVCG